MIKKLCIILVVLIIGSIAVAHRLYRHNSHLVSTYNALRLHPLGPEPETLQNRHPDLVLIGDSHCEKWPIADLAPRQAVSLGVGAQTSHQALLRARHLERLPEGLPIILVSLGTNDLQCIGSFPHQSPGIVRQTLENIRDLAATTRAERLIVMTIPPRGRYRASYHSLDLDAMDTARLRLNDDIRALASEDLIILDADRLLTAKHIGPDGIHLTSKGYAVLNRELIEILNTPAK